MPHYHHKANKPKIKHQWLDAKNYAPRNTNNANPIWIRDNIEKPVLGYYVKSMGYFDLNGNGIRCTHWCKVLNPDELLG